eukprot:m.29295 g.29295  ORF g.29295 m.29295 type:complete len:254 (-) comp12096_c0_seq1:132-893(-)
MPQGREDQNSSCALFLSIIFVLMLFGSGKDGSNSRTQHLHQDLATTTTPVPISFDENGSAIYNTNDPHDPRYGNGHHAPSRTQSAKVVVMLFGTLMLVQMLGFCFVIAIRRRAIQSRNTNEYSGTQISRGGDGWGMYEEEDPEDDAVVETHPIIANLHAAAAADEDPDLPSYDEAMLCDDDAVPTYTASDTVHSGGGGGGSSDSNSSSTPISTAQAPASARAPADFAFPMVDDSDGEDIGDDVPLMSSSASRD